MSSRMNAALAPSVLATNRGRSETLIVNPLP